MQGDDFIIHNHDVKLTRHNAQYYPKFYIHPDLAVYLGWFVDKGSNSYELGPNLILEVPDGAIPDPLDLPSPSNTKFWNYSNVDDLSGAWNYYIQLSMTCNWKFTNVNRTFGSVRKPSTRSLFIYSDVGSSGVVGNQVTDLLREVSYKRQGK